MKKIYQILDDRFPQEIFSYFSDECSREFNPSIYLENWLLEGFFHRNNSLPARINLETKSKEYWINGRLQKVNYEENISNK